MNSAIVALVLLSPAAAPAPAQAAPDARENVRNGLKWLAEKQKADGSWESLNDFAPTTISALSGTALLMQGSTLKDGTYAPHLRKLVAYFEKNTDEKGKIASTGQNEMFQYIPSHAQALLFLACVYDV